MRNILATVILGSMLALTGCVVEPVGGAVVTEPYPSYYGRPSYGGAVVVPPPVVFSPRFGGGGFHHDHFRH